jgi:hypothetical protein
MVDRLKVRDQMKGSPSAPSVEQGEKLTISSQKTIDVAKCNDGFWMHSLGK